MYFHCHSLKKVTEIILYDSTIRIFPKLESVEKVCNSKFKIKKFVSISNFKVECPLYQKRLRKLISKIILTTFSNNSFSVSLSSLLSNLHHNMFQFCFRLHVFTLFSHCGSKHYKIGTPHMLFKGSKYVLLPYFLLCWLWFHPFLSMKTISCIATCKLNYYWPSFTFLRT